jgi:hypothetical protein
MPPREEPMTRPKDPWAYYGKSQSRKYDHLKPNPHGDPITAQDIWWGFLGFAFFALIARCCGG